MIISQYYLLGDSLTLGFKPDDWILYFNYKLLGENPLSKIFSVWTQRGLYTTYQVYYMGFLDKLFGLNYYSFHLINLIFKIIASISLYPLVLLLFKNRVLAFISVILFSISHSAAGPLEFVVKGSDYLAIFWMNLFFIAYYLIIAKRLNELKYNLILLALFILALGSSPIRLFPLIIIPPLIEAFNILKREQADIKKGMLRLLFFYLPFIPLILYSPVSALGDSLGPLGVIKKISEGNWHLIPSPFSGIGFTFIAGDLWTKIFGLIEMDNFKNYFFFLLGGPTIIFGLLTFIISRIIISRNRLSFFILTLLISYLFEILIFFTVFKASYDGGNLYSAIFGGYIAIAGFMVFLNWLKQNTQDMIQIAFWSGAGFLFLFTFLTWFFAPLGTSFNEMSYYLVVSSIGSSLLTAAFFTALYKKIKLYGNKLLPFLVFLAIIPMFQMSSSEIRSTYFQLNKDGRGAQGQIIMQMEAETKLADFKEGNSALFYFDTSDITGWGPFYSEGFLTSFPFFMLMSQDKVRDGCVGLIYENNKMTELRKTIEVQGKSKGFYYRALCINNGKQSIPYLFFNLDNFYAFKIYDKKLIDIKENILKELNLEYYSSKDQ